jgi:hypothetical protein
MKPAKQKAAKEPRKVGRPRNGKRSDDAYAQVSAWIRKETHRKVKIRLLREGDEHSGRDFSVLVEELLAAWLSRK